VKESSRVALNVQREIPIKENPSNRGLQMSLPLTSLTQLHKKNEISFYSKVL
jgi:hypothetical protein